VVAKKSSAASAQLFGRGKSSNKVTTEGPGRANLAVRGEVDASNAGRLRKAIRIKLVSRGE
jgi:hypothetical protein